MIIPFPLIRRGAITESSELDISLATADANVKKKLKSQR